MKTTSPKWSISIVFVILAIGTVAWTLFAEEEAITTSGKRIVVKDDGTWVSAPIQSMGEADFRNTKWGMTRPEAQLAEKIQTKDIVFDSDKGFAVTQTVSGMPCTTFYIFAFNKLVRTKYSFDIKHTNETDFITVDYPKVKKMLADKYGRPKEEKTYWKNDLYKDDPSEWGMALQVGHLMYYTRWETDTSSIFLFLSGENYEVNFGVEYTSIFLGDLEDNEDAQKSKSEF